MSVPESKLSSPLAAQDLLAGSMLIHEVVVPAEVLLPAAAESASAGTVRLRPLNVGRLSLISRAAREDPSLVPILMIKEAMVDPSLTIDQIRQLHIGLVDFLVGQINLISGLTEEGGSLSSAAQSTLGKTHLLLARHFGWTPEQVSQLTPAQVGIYLAGVEKFLAWDDAHKDNGE
jgi:hypothetical protein